MVAPICYSAGLFFLVDFQGHVLDLANSVNPVITQTRNPTITNNQKWDPIPVNAGQTNFIFQPPVGASAMDDVFLSYTTSATGGSPLFLQATCETFSSEFELDCVNSTAGSILEVTSGLALTAWPVEDGSTIAPVTYETFTGRAEQEPQVTFNSFTEAYLPNLVAVENNTDSGEPATLNL
ncbi:hypothetical protein B0H17DRAFT_1150529 [Mycena rosella]|uniref:Uncharacterized protein n=1 Tax=Mycena rosella TaxID=1033263 RepID=A0AAD7FN03_MYCRO|nr:hypothetical protein B0H17DRAFT_1150529 [Mycena rosella]